MSNHAIQTSYSLKPAIGYKGMIAKDSSRAVIKAGLSATRKLVSVAVTGATNGETLDIVINGTTFSVTLDGSATVAEAVAALVSEINDGDEPVLASGTTTPLLLESTIDAPYNADFTDHDRRESPDHRRLLVHRVGDEPRYPRRPSGAG
jgi:hypothetical protein